MILWKPKNPFKKAKKSFKDPLNTQESFKDPLNTQESLKTSLKDPLKT